MIIRQPIYAGAHYFGDAGRLRASVEAWIEDALQARVAGDVLGLIVPRGLHREMGPIVGAGYKMLLTTPQRFDAVTLLAPNLRQPEIVLACEPADAYETPLGLLSIDRILVETLEAHGVPVAHDTDADDVIEAQLPFLQTVLGEVPIVPFRVGSVPNAGDSLIAQAAKLGFLLICANLPLGREKTTLALLENGSLDVSQVTNTGGLLGSLGTRTKLTAWSADLETLALGAKLLRAQGATHLQVLRQGPGMAALVAV